MRGFLDLKCDERTHGRTDKRDSLRSIGVAERPKNINCLEVNEQKTAQNSIMSPHAM